MIVLDNVEQLVPIGPSLISLLDASGALAFLLTSRALLRVSREVTYAVSPLPVPCDGGSESVEALAQNAAVTLFVQRAAAIEPAFGLTEANAPAVAEICRRLDGLPLALQLAAARIRVLSPAELCSRMTSRLALLTAGSVDLPVRQQTLRNTLEWSHALLTAEEQRLLRRMAVFAGGCTLEGVEAICNTRRDLGLVALDGVSSLLDKNLIYLADRNGGDRRFMMLETVREFALEQLDASGERAALQHAHAAYAIVLAEEVVSRKSPAQLADWLSTCDDERDNLRAALAFLVGTDGAAVGASSEYGAVPLLGAAGVPHGSPRLARGRPRAAGSGDTHRRASPCTELRCGAGERSGRFSGRVGPSASRRWTSLVSSATGRARSNALNSLVVTSWFFGDYGAALEWSERTLQACREVGDKEAIAAALSNLADVVLRLGRHDDAERLLHESSTLFAGLGDQNGIAWCCNHLGDVAAARGQRSEAREFYERGAGIFTSTGNGWGLARSMCDFGHLACDAGDIESARAAFLRGMAIFGEIGAQTGDCGRARRRRAHRARSGAAGTRAHAGGRGRILAPHDRRRRTLGAGAAAGGHPGGRVRMLRRGRRRCALAGRREAARRRGRRLRAHDGGADDASSLKFAGLTSRRTASTRLTGSPTMRPCSSNQRLVRRKVDAIDSVVGDEAVNPLDFGSQLAERFERLERGLADFRVGQLRRSRHHPLDDELGHVSLFAARGWRAAPRPPQA